jgi:alkyl hydroperoxide reductase subunit AhpC
MEDEAEKRTSLGRALISSQDGHNLNKSITFTQRLILLYHAFHSHYQRHGKHCVAPHRCGLCDALTRLFSGIQFPDFTGVTQETDSFDLYDYLGDSWGLIFMHPSDFLPVCTTELGEAAKRHDEFEAKNVKMCAVSCSDVESHKLWIEDIRAVTGADINFPIVADPDRDIAAKLGVLDRTNFAVEASNVLTGVALTARQVFILKPDKAIAVVLTYPAAIGRNFDELARIIDALQLVEDKHVETPVNWTAGQDTVAYFLLSDEDADAMFGEHGYTVQDLPSKKRYMRWVKT